MTQLTKRIMLVEDEQVVGLLAKTALERYAPKNGLSVEVVWAVDAASALSALQSEGFDLVLTDYRLPDRTGAELFSAIRQGATNTPAGTRPDIPIVLFTGGSLPDESGEGGYDAVIYKPCTPQGLVTPIFQLLHRSLVLLDHIRDGPRGRCVPVVV